MPLTLYNTLTNAAEPFTPADPSLVTFYSCGPTVYDFAHIGNFRSFLVADLARRWIASPLCELTSRSGTVSAGPRRVIHVMNITDVGHMTDDAAADGAGEDKMAAAAERLASAKKAGTLPTGVTGIDPADPRAIAAYYARAFLDDARTLGLTVATEQETDPRLMPRASEHVTAMLRVIADLLASGAAYQTSGAVYFDTSACPDYGVLSGNTIDRLRAGAGGRVDAADQSVKKHPADFLLWKHDETHLMRWDPDVLLGRPTGLGVGYPGWHIECTAMSLEAFRDLLGDPSLGTIDLHSGGEDNIFPHHECEIAQSRAFTGSDTFARCWLHTRHLMVEGAKMSKSAGNFFTIRDLLAKGFSPGAIRLELLKTHYRTNANFTEQGLRDSERLIGRWRRFLERAESSATAGAPNHDARDEFTRAMNDDLNTAGALGAVNRWINSTPDPGESDASLLRLVDDTLGVLSLGNAGAQDADAEVLRLLAERESARQNKDWAESDRLRDQLAAMGIEIKDSPSGTTWTRTARLSREP